MYLIYYRAISADNKTILMFFFFSLYCALITQSKRVVCLRLWENVHRVAADCSFVLYIIVRIV